MMRKKMTKFEFIMDVECEYIPDAHDSNVLYENMPMETFVRVRNMQESQFINWYGTNVGTNDQWSDAQRLRALHEQQEYARLTQQRAMFEMARNADESRRFHNVGRIIG